MARTTKFPAWLEFAAAKLKQNRLWQRMVKHTISVTIVLIIVLIPAVSSRYGTSTYLAAMTAVFAHSGQRFGQMAESLFLVFSGMVLGLGWSLLGLYLSSLLFHSNQAAAYTVRALFVAVAVMFHGLLRSHTPRLFVMVFMILILCFGNLMGTKPTVTLSTATSVLYPILTAMGVLLVVNVTVFPEFSSRFLGETIIQILSQTDDTLKDSVQWFMEPTIKREEMGAGPESPAGSHEDNTKRTGNSNVTDKGSRVARLATLAAAKPRLRAKLASCKKTYRECTFEIIYSVLPPRSLKPISNTAMSHLVRNVITLISACESKFALIGEDGAEEKSPDHEDESSSDSSDSDAESASDSESATTQSEAGSTKARKKSRVARRPAVTEVLQEIKPRREISSADVDILESLLSRVRKPVAELLAQVNSATDLVITCLAYCYDVERLPSGIITPKGIRLEEIDIRVDIFAAAITSFDKSSTEALANVALENGLDGEVDIMPRIESFLMSSCLLSLRQAAEQTMQMLRHSRVLVERRQAKNNRRRVYLPRKIKWRKWLLSGGEQDGMTLPETARKDVRTGKDTKRSKTTDNSNGDKSETPGDIAPMLSRSGDEEAAINPPRKEARQKQPYQVKPKEATQKGSHSTSPVLRSRGVLADLVESTLDSEHVAYALKLTAATFLLSWPAFYAPFNSWFSSTRATWAPLQLILVFEVAIGSSFWIFVVRAAGVIFGCLSGFLAYTISRGNRVGMVVILVVCIIPSTYVQLGTTYVKAGMISIVSMSVVSIAITGGLGVPWELFVKRLVAFMVGGAVAILVEMTVYPVRARDRLVESLTSCVNQVGQMERALSIGVEEPAKIAYFRSPRFAARFNKAKGKAQNSLTAAETFLPFCLTEPRLRGSFKSLEPIYREILYVLRQIIDRMDNVTSLRQAYGSSVLENLNSQVYSYRRNLAASITLTLFVVNEALVTRLPLPQFLPSCRLAQFRLVNRVREVMQYEPPPTGAAIAGSNSGQGSQARSRANSAVIRNASQQSFLSWNAITAGQMEIIEYLEELVDLTKLLVGVSAFRSGMLDRPSYQNYVSRLKLQEKTRLLPSDGPTHRPSASDEAGGGAAAMTPITSAPTVVGRTRTLSSTGVSNLERSLTSAFHINRVRRKLRSNVEAQRSRAADTEATTTAAQEEDELPPSLQRVGTRMRAERAIARRATMSRGQ